ncbi:hypothetical protein Micbo1qcDRAFT_150508 [Microdochium bolleyi]|uniref:PLD phosphodiesterase domain-containing protein n=1 Tax=Microdochium bolleyi TaxID=196109 RepID=A0A136IWD7_9PEZI|nr:hypothetical protein Micbo1qcDRAFT_150508 [Microdochium bolleyi]
MPHILNDSKYSGDETGGQKISDAVASACQSDDSVLEILAQDLSLSAGDAWKELEKRHKNASRGLLPSQRHSNDNGEQLSNDELELAFGCGKWGNKRPSDLFLRLYHDALCTLNDNLSEGVTSPSLLGSSGTVPLSVLSVIPDIVRHMSNLIVRAEEEVFLATNFWQNSTASKYITNAIKELSRRAGERGRRITIKVMYDRGSAKQLFGPHQLVPEKEYTGDAVGLPAAHEIPHIDLEVQNFHVAMLGTFHSKFMIVDRKIGILQSNNIQDNDNLEMMVHVEGPIVDGLYDMALLSWHEHMNPCMPLLNTSKPRHPSSGDPVGLPVGHGGEVPQQQQQLPHEQNGDSFAIADLKISTSSIDLAVTQLLPEHTHDDPHYDDDIAGEAARVQAAVGAKPSRGETQMGAITRHLNHTVNPDFEGDSTLPTTLSGDEMMTPYILHPQPQEPFPIALVNRPPYGPPNSRSLANPQNAAWLSAMRNAERDVFIQTPTLNAGPLVPAIVEACERGVDVYCYVCLGYNDAGELLPMQGGHNEMIASHLFSLLPPTSRNRLHYYWYVGKDQTVPIVADKFRKRSCHVKLMIVDESVAIVGSGNQDTQSWFHSQEVNIMLESEEVCGAWIDGLRRNQNTHRYGELDRRDGVWRDKKEGSGKEAEGATGVDPGRFSWMKGVTGAIKRVQGTGGF